MWRLLVGVVWMVFSACGAPSLEFDRERTFGDVAAGESLALPFVLTNSGAAPADLVLESGGDFTVEPTTLRLGPGRSGTAQVLFSPTALGLREGVLLVRERSNTWQVALSGRATGPALSVESPGTLGLIPLVDGGLAQPKTIALVLGNDGTPGSVIQLGTPRVEGGAELCVGEFVDGGCVTWRPEAPLAAGLFAKVPLSVLPADVGPRRWTVVLPSDDAFRPEVRVELVGRIEAFEPCVFTLPGSLTLQAGFATLTLRHEGSGTCLVEGVKVTSVPAAAARVEVSAPLPHPLSTGESMSVTVLAQPSAPSTLTGRLEISTAGAATQFVSFQKAPLSPVCLVVAPTSLDFGPVTNGCSSASKWVTFYNACSSPITLASIELSAGDFQLRSAPPAGSELRADPSGPLVVELAYRPSSEGAHLGSLLIRFREGAEASVALRGRGTAAPEQVDRFRSDPLPVTDLLVLVDASPSFVPRRAVTRDNLERLFRSANFRCTDLRLGLVAADGAPDAGVDLLRSDAGARWFSSQDPGFADQALGAFDSLAVGSEVEACARLAADVMGDAGARSGLSSLAGLCITDAVEQSSSPLAALDQFVGLVDGGVPSWSVVSGKGTSCGLESSDDGTHAALVRMTAGAHLDICESDWASWLLPLGLPTCALQTTFYLSSPATTVTAVTMEGRTAPAASWHLDATQNAIVFSAGMAPRRGETLEVRYATSACGP